MSEPAIKVDGLSKRYRIGLEEEQHDTLFGAMASWVQSPMENYRRVKRLSSFGQDEADDIIWALKDVSFEVERGEVVGVIGRNGAGKSTLLKILSHITEPTSGYAKIRGRVSSLLEVGTGFHEELTGRENVYLNGTILGMSKAEVDRKFDEIVAFSGVEKFIDTPVKRYSSGMKVRLAFAVAAHLEPEILLIDEVLAVGDAGFQKKCLGKMDDITQEGRTVLFVSHDMSAVASLCDRTILLDEGCVTYDGQTGKVIDEYIALCDKQAEIPLAERTDRKGNASLQFQEIVMVGENGRITDTVTSGSRVHLCFKYASDNEIATDSLRVSIGIRDSQDRVLFVCPNDVVQSLSKRVIPPEGWLQCTIPKLPLPEGAYRFNLFSSVDNQITDWIEDAARFEVVAGDFYNTGKLPPSSHRGVLVDFKWEEVEKPANMFSEAAIER